MRYCIINYGETADPRNGDPNCANLLYYKEEWAEDHDPQATKEEATRMTEQQAMAVLDELRKLGWPATVEEVEE